MWRYIKDLFCDWFELFLQTFGPILFIVGVMVGIVASSPWVYIPIFFVCFLFPSIYFAVSAFGSAGKAALLSLHLRRQLCVIISILLLLGFLGALVLKVSFLVRL